jgi:hypothetical protein
MLIVKQNEVDDGKAADFGRLATQVKIQTQSHLTLGNPALEHCRREVHAREQLLYSRDRIDRDIHM